MPKQGGGPGTFSTPDDFMQAIKARLGIEAFHFDFAADATNHKAKRYWTESTDALAQPAEAWASQVEGGWGWLNPPFSKIGPWAQRCAEASKSGAHIAFLVPAAVGSNWFRDFVAGQSKVLLLNGRLSFMPDKPKWLYPKDCICCLYGPELNGYSIWNWRASSLVGSSLSALAD